MRLLFVCALFLLLLAQGSWAAAEPGLDSYLKRVGLERYLLERDVYALLAEGVDRASMDEIEDVLERLEPELDRTGEEGAMWRELAGQVLDGLPDDRGLTIRLALARGRLGELSVAIERVLLGIGDAEPSAVRRTVGLLRVEVEDLVRQFDKRVASIDKRRERSSDLSGDIEEAFAEVRSNRMDAAYRAMWASFYSAVLLSEFEGDDRLAAEAARGALVWCEWVLRGGPSSNGIDLAVIESTGFEVEQRAWAGVIAGYARTIERPAYGEGLLWLELMGSGGSGEVHTRVLSQLSRYRIGAYGAADSWRRASGVLELLVESGGDGVVAAARRLLVLAANASRVDGFDSDQDAAVEAAFSVLLSEGAARDAVELADRLPAEGREAGFVHACLLAMKRYSEAVDAHVAASGDVGGALYRSVVSDESVYGAYRTTALLFEQSLANPDADGYSRSHATVYLFRGIALMTVAFAGGDGAEESAGAAVGSLVEAADRMSGGEQADALYLAAIVAPLGGDESLARSVRERFQAVEQGTERSAALAFETQLELEGDDEEQVMLLLSVSRESSAYEASQRRAAVLLYGLYRDASGARRDEYASWYVEVAGELFALDESRVLGGDRGSLEVAVGRGVRLVRAMLDVEAGGAGQARGVLDRVERLIGMLGDEGSEAWREADFLRVRVLVASGEYEAAEELSDVLLNADPGYQDAVDRVLFRAVSERWDLVEGVFDPSDELHVRVSERAIGVAERLLASGDSFGGDELRSIRLLAGRVLFVQSRFAGDDAIRRRAVGFLRAVSKEGAVDRSAEERLVVLYEELGEVREALVSCRRLLGGTRAGTDDWFGLKAVQVRLLMRADRVQAVAVMEQLVVLYPELGPEPSRGELVRMRDALGVGGGDGGSG